MNPILLLLPVLLSSADPPVPHPGEIRLTIARDPYSSSDHVTLCRVRVTNDGTRSWPGRMLRFEARATDAVPVVRQRGRFGLELSPYGSLETLIALPGRHNRFEVELLTAGASRDDMERKPRKRVPGRKSRKRQRSR
jgi:hypothetical protein